MKKIQDVIDTGILTRTNENPGAHIREIIRPFLDQRSESVLRTRVEALARAGLIRLEPSKKEVRCYPMESVTK